jgi:GMP synthase (glutamine-hydrolysing) B subunit
MLRQDEAQQILKRFERLKLPLVFADASKLFLDRLAGVTDPEKKRKIIGATFIDVFEAEAAKLGQVDFLAQGTLYPDVIESIAIVGQSSMIKSHHNVGGLPARMRMVPAVVNPVPRQAGRHSVWRCRNFAEFTDDRSQARRLAALLDSDAGLVVRGASL